MPSSPCSLPPLPTLSRISMNGSASTSPFCSDADDARLLQDEHPPGSIPCRDHIHRPPESLGDQHPIRCGGVGEGWRHRRSLSGCDGGFGCSFGGCRLTGFRHQGGRHYRFSHGSGYLSRFHRSSHSLGNLSGAGSDQHGDKYHNWK